MAPITALKQQPVMVNLPNIQENSNSINATTMKKFHQLRSSNPVEASRIINGDPAPKTHRSSNKAVLDIERLNFEKGENNEVSFKLVDAEKFNVVVPPNQLVTVAFAFNMKDPLTNQEVIKPHNITVLNTKSKIPKLISFAFDEQGRPMLRGNKVEVTDPADSTRTKTVRNYLTADQMQKHAANYSDGIKNGRERDQKSGFFVDLSVDEFSEFAKDMAAQDTKDMPVTMLSIGSEESARRMKYDSYFNNPLNRMDDLQSTLNQLSIERSKKNHTHITADGGQVKKSSIEVTSTAQRTPDDEIATVDKALAACRNYARYRLQ